MQIKHTLQFGFTLIEMLVVASIVVLLTSVLMLGYSSASRTARDKQRETDIKQVQVALEEYYDTYGSYPVANSMSALMGVAAFTPFLQNGKVQDPVNIAPYQYAVNSTATTYQLSYTKESDQTLNLVTPIGH